MGDEEEIRVDAAQMGIYMPSRKDGNIEGSFAQAK